MQSGNKKQHILLLDIWKDVGKMDGKHTDVED